MTAFPRLRSGAVTQYPSRRRLETSTHAAQFVDGSEQRFRMFGAPVKRWHIELHQASEDEVAAVRRFFEQQQGRNGSFAFVDPWDGVEYPNCSLEADEVELQFLSDGQCKTTIAIRNNQV
jgi:hypothetical protein